MRKIFIFSLLSTLALGSCRTKCPAYSATKPATQVATAITASAALTTPERQ
ncbi:MULTISPECIES: hypothetical protein [Hymenobacter]|uniref:Lipoprotein n=1 Tax=Hymenobacter mucosus TaxID=1411120 RepID=A0A238Y1R1_9BACT|nr:MULTISPECIES: hypothetical protein [Hymenobacter]SNR64593.1 hypothetical protein SAMN06269173_104540 [Hymenobacter mucosus]